MSPVLVAGLTLALAAGCDSVEAERSAAGPAERWSLADEPTLHIGVLEGEDAYQLHDVRDARRLPGGRVALANQGTREVRIYTPEGRFLVGSGEDGDGPGQWRAISSVHAAGGDTLLVADHRLGRHGLVDLATGDYIGAAGSARIERIVPGTWHHRGLLLEAPPRVPGPEVFAAVVEALSVGSDAAPGFVRLDPAGRVWVWGTTSAVAPTLRLFDLDGRLHATLPLPGSFRPTDVGPSEILGVWRDALDVEHVRAYALPADAAWSAPSVEEVLNRAPRALAPGEAELPAVSEGFRAIATAQEIHYAMHASYTDDLDRLSEVRAFALPEGVRADIFDATPTGWRGRLVDTATGAGCTLVYGAYPPVGGLEPGRLSCWPPSPD